MRKVIVLLLCIGLGMEVFGGCGMSAKPSKPKILILTLLDSTIGNDTMREVADKIRGTVDVDYYSFGCDYDVARPLPADLDFSSYSAILLYEEGVFLSENIKEKLAAAKKNTRLIVMNPFAVDGTVDLAEHPDLQQYWNNMSRENAYRMLVYIATRFCGCDGKVQPPVVYPDIAFYHPDSDRVFEDLPAYVDWYAGNENGNHRWSADSPTVGVLFYKTLYTKQKAAVVDALIRKIEAEGANAVALYSRNAYPIDSLFMLNGEKVVDTIITMSSNLNWRDKKKGVDAAKTADVPILFGKNHYYFSPEDWEKSDTGLSKESMPSVVYAEMNGIIEPTVISGKVVTEEGGRYNKPIDYQVNWLVDRALSWARLHRLDNAEKKIAITYWSEGGGKHDVGADIDYYLDAPASLTKLMGAMKKHGYDLGENDLPKADRLIELMSERGSNMGVWDKKELHNRVEAYPENVILVPEEQYVGWFEAIPTDKQKEVIEVWGAPPGNVMVYENDGEKFIVIPNVKFGNVMLLPNPTWGLLQNDKVLYGKGAFPPHHQYIAFWHWINNAYKADAVLTVFSQLAIMPGKQVGISRYDWGGILLQDLPHILPFPIQANSAVTNKRRTQAVIVDYLPTIVTSGLYEELLVLENEINHYRQSDGSLQKQYEKSIIKQCRDSKIDQDLSIDLDTVEMPELIGKLEAYLAEVRAEHMPYGPHVLSEPPTGSELVEMLHSMLGKQYDAAVKKLSSENDAGNSLLKAVILDGRDFPTAQKTVLGGSSDKLAGYLAVAVDYAERLKGAEREIPQILAAFDGRYIEPGPGDDPIRNPDAVPTGRNSYAFDHREMPTPEAWEVGKQLAENIIDQHLEEDGEYPRKVAFVLWSSEAVKHHGVMESEILYLMGVEPIWDERQRVVDVRLIPASELKRPRIDVLVNTSSLYRDNFQNKILLLDKAARLAADANEPQNFIRENSNAIKESLLAKGHDDGVAQDLSRARIFSEALGAHSPNIQFAIQAGETWREDDDLSDLFVDRASHIYGEKHLGIEGRDVYRENLINVDVGVFSRSSNVYGVLDHHMVAAYLGGLNMSVRNTSGKSIDMYISNLRNPEAPKAETLNRFFSRELRSRYFNPKWIEGMQEHGYDGTRYIQEFTGGLWLWDVTSPDVVTEEMWDEVNAVYIEDKHDLGMEEFFENNNPYAMQSIVSTMLEAKERDYWHPTQEVFENLVRVYAESVARNGISGSRESASQAMHAVMNEALSQIPDVQPELIEKYRQQVEKSVTKVETVKGYEMEDVKPREKEDDPLLDMRKVFISLMLSSIAIVILCGWFHERKQQVV